jgi:hypothetical protein
MHKTQVDHFVDLSQTVALRNQRVQIDDLEQHRLRIVASKHRRLAPPTGWSKKAPEVYSSDILNTIPQADFFNGLLGLPPASELTGIPVRTRWAARTEARHITNGLMPLRALAARAVKVQLGKGAKRPAPPGGRLRRSASNPAAPARPENAPDLCHFQEPDHVI